MKKIDRRGSRALSERELELVSGGLGWMIDVAVEALTVKPPKDGGLIEGVQSPRDLATGVSSG